MELSNVRRLRASRRFKLFLSTRVRLGQDTVPAHLLDVSTTGALVTATKPAAVGTRVFIRLLGGVRGAKVVRRDGREFGVEFAEPLTDAEVEALLRSQDEQDGDEVVAA